MTVVEALQSSTQHLKDAGIDECRLESEYLVAAAVNIPRTRLVLERHRPLQKQARIQLNRWVTERAGRKPLAYVLGRQPFMDLDLAVDASVLIPRPETELLVERAVKVMGDSRRLVVDVGTGSGNIAISLARQNPRMQVIGIDVSPEALRVARANAKSHGITAQCEWREGDLLAPLLQKGEKADMIVANLPYVKSGDIDALQPELRWEPRGALDGGPDGLKLIFRLIDQAINALSAKGILLLEIGAEQSTEVTRKLVSSGAWENIQMFRDLAGLPRIIQSIRKDNTWTS